MTSGHICIVCASFMQNSINKYVEHVCDSNVGAVIKHDEKCPHSFCVV